MSSSDFFTEKHGLIDFHSHILPGADHGSENLETSIAQLRLAKNNSVEKILATPHFYPAQHSVDEFISLRNNAAKKLLSESDSNIPQIKLGAEVLLCDGLDRLPGLENLCFSNTKYIMIELPFLDFSENMAATVEAIADHGFKVILAHADRYPKNSIDFLLDYGVHSLQINALSLCSHFKKKHIYRWMEKGLVSMLGSDIHRIDKRAYQNFSKAQKRIEPYLSHIKEKSDAIWNEIESIK